MGNFMIPVCCICGRKSLSWHNKEWEDSGGLQEFCPEHANLLKEIHGEFIGYLVPHMMESKDESRIL